jgi:hypothetical protein
MALAERLHPPPFLLPKGGRKGGFPIFVIMQPQFPLLAKRSSVLMGPKRVLQVLDGMLMIVGAGR